MGVAYFAIPSLQVDPATAGGPVPSGWVWAGQAALVGYGLGGAWFFRRTMLRRMTAVAPEGPDVDGGADQIVAVYNTTQKVVASLWFAVMTTATLATFLTGDATHTVVGLIIAAVSAPLLAPTSRRIATEDRQLQATGVGWSLRAVLYDTPGPAGPAGLEPA